MDPRHFDSLVRRLGLAATRRGALGAILAGLIAPILPDIAEADRKKGKGKPDRSRSNGKIGSRGKGRGQKKRGAGPARSQQRGGACRGEGHPCEGNQRCCDDLVCIVSGPGAAKRCTPCGAAGQPCCDDDSCGDGAVCESGECVGCGSTGLSCCQGRVCDDGFNCDDDGVCVACGGAGDPCCDEGDACVGDGLVCNADGECETCGGGGALCCAGGTCDTGFTCDPDGVACVACGAAAGQLCCDTGDPCGAGLVCAGGSCTPCGGGGQSCCAGSVCGADLVCDGGVCESCLEDEVVCGVGSSAQCVPGVCCENGDGPGCDGGLTCIAGGCIDADQFRIVLRWGENPRDIDSHLWLPPGPNQYHVYWRDKGALGGFPNAELDIDDITSFGPETITIAELEPGTYVYAVHHYSGTGTIGTSGAKVEVYQGPNLVRSYSAPVAAPWSTQDDVLNPYNDGVIWWQVFALDYDGTTTAITDINTASTNAFVPYGTLVPTAALRRSTADVPLKSRVADGNIARRRSQSRRRRARR